MYSRGWLTADDGRCQQPFHPERATTVQLAQLEAVAGREIPLHHTHSMPRPSACNCRPYLDASAPLAYYLVMGYDGREPIHQLSCGWDTARRSRYLLRPEVVAPLAVDRTVWPTVAGLKDEERWNADEPWFKLSELLDALDPILQKRSKPLDVIAIAGVCETQPTVWPDPMMPMDDDVNPKEISDTWSFLGFDVANWYSDVSALTNTGYPAASMEAYVATWAPLLNDNHLFEKLADAWRFARFSDDRISSHAPFHVFGLWHVTRLYAPAVV